MQSVTVPGLYPTGEGAGYAGGIISAAGMSAHRASALCQAQCPKPISSLHAAETFSRGVCSLLCCCAVDGLKVGEQIVSELATSRSSAEAGRQAIS